MKAANSTELQEQAQRLANSLLHFTRVMYTLRTGRKFDIGSRPEGCSHFEIIINKLQEVFDGKCKRLIINVSPRWGKAISVETPVFTKEGFKIAKDITTNDYLIGSSGWTKVTGVFPQGILKAKKLKFVNGAEVICNDEHLWNVQDRYTRKFKTLKTSEIEKTLHEADGRKHWRIPMINGDYGDLKPFINPYLFGCWLGDGHSHYAAITSMDEDIIQAFRDDGHTMNLHTHQSAGKAKTYGIVGNGLNALLKEKNLLKNKHIPDEVLIWSKQDRISLLQGLMDTDGTCGLEGDPSFSNTNKDIIRVVKSLICSLGGTFTSYIRKCGNENLNIRLPNDINPFRLKRKLERVSKSNRCLPRRFISEITDGDPIEMVCFSVDSPDKLFCVGKEFLLTHNTEIMIHAIAWAIAQYPDSNHMYISYSHALAKKQTQTIREIIQMREYKDLFNVELKEGSKEKSAFETKQSGVTLGLGAQSSITGKGAGLKGVLRYGGGIYIDDIIKPEDALSDTVRESVNEWFYNTLISRVNSPNTPIIVLGQRTHEDDLCARLIASGGWDVVSLPAMDEALTPLYPEMHSQQYLLNLQKESPWVYAAQYAQDPVAGGSTLFNPGWFQLLDVVPDNIISTFLTCDTAETSMSYNDASVFSFWGLYKATHRGNILEKDGKPVYCLFWIDCLEIRVEPKDLEDTLMDFYAGCCRFKVQPSFIAVEKKSSGVSLISALSNIQGLRVVNIERTAKSGSKSARFLELQPFIAQKLIALPSEGKHTSMCVRHMSKITANNAHRHDDIADTLYDAVKLALIDKVVVNSSANLTDYNEIGKKMNIFGNKLDNLKQKAYRS